MTVVLHDYKTRYTKKEITEPREEKRTRLEWDTTFICSFVTLAVLFTQPGHTDITTLKTRPANFLQNAAVCIHDYTVSEPRRPQSENVTPYPTVTNSCAERSTFTDWHRGTSRLSAVGGGQQILRVTVSAQQCPSSSHEQMQLTGLTTQEQPLLLSINEATPFITIARGLYNDAATT